MLARIEEAGRIARNGKPPKGAKWVMAVPVAVSRPLQRQPWFEERRRMVCWAHPRAPETRAYVSAYWDFQSEYRMAATAFHAGDTTVVFPKRAYVPMRWEPPSAGAIAAA